MTNLSLHQEANLFGKYFLKKLPGEREKNLYVKLAGEITPPLELTEQRILRFALNNKWSIGLLDAGCAFIRPQSELRRRLHLMFAILECSSEYNDLFLPKQRSPFFLLILIFNGVAAIVKALVGSLILKYIL